MEISKDIIVREINKIKSKFEELEKLFLDNTVLECETINGTIEALKENKVINGTEKKEIMKKLKLSVKALKEISSDIISKDSELEKYCGKTVYAFSVNRFPYKKDEIENKFKEKKESVDNKILSVE